MLPQAVGSPPPPSGQRAEGLGEVGSGRWGVLPDILITNIVYKIS